MTAMTDRQAESLRTLRWPWMLLKAAVVALVLYMLGRHLRMLAREWSEQAEAFHTWAGNKEWLIAALSACAGAQVCFGVFWGRLLKRLGLAARRFDVLKAYSVGTLGKYVPGKAMVVVLRSALIRGGKINRLSVGFTVFYETSATMSVGGAVAAVCLLLVAPHQWMFWAGAAALAGALAIGLHPAVFGRLAGLVALPLNRVGPDPFNRASLGPPYFTARACYTVFGHWSVLPLAGWSLLGVSFWAVARATGLPCDSAADVALLTGTAAAATAAGFVVLFMPAGLGVRELVIIHLLAPRYGASQAVLASLLLRTIWTLAELGLAGILYSLPLSPRWVTTHPVREKVGSVDGPTC